MFFLIKSLFLWLFSFFSFSPYNSLYFFDLIKSLYLWPYKVFLWPYNIIVFISLALKALEAQNPISPVYITKLKTCPDIAFCFVICTWQTEGTDRITLVLCSALGTGGWEKRWFLAPRIQCIMLGFFSFSILFFVHPTPPDPIPHPHPPLELPNACFCV